MEKRERCYSLKRLGASFNGVHLASENQSLSCSLFPFLLPTFYFPIPQAASPSLYFSYFL